MRFGHTLLREGELVLFVEPRSDGRAWELDFHAVRRSLDAAAEFLRRSRPAAARRSPPRLT